MSVSERLEHGTYSENGSETNERRNKKCNDILCAYKIKIEIFNTRFSNFQFRRSTCGSLGIKKNWVCKQTLCVSETSVKMARHCAVKDCGNGDYTLERWKKAHTCSTRALSGICTCEEPFKRVM